MKRGKPDHNDALILMEVGKMFYETLMTDEEQSLQQEVRRFACEEVSHDMVRALDRD